MEHIVYIQEWCTRAMFTVSLIGGQLPRVTNISICVIRTQASGESRSKILSVYTIIHSHNGEGQLFTLSVPCPSDTTIFTLICGDKLCKRCLL